jgi:hypothetical protein
VSTSVSARCAKTALCYTDAAVLKMTFFGCMALLVRSHILDNADYSHRQESSVLIWVVLE